MNYIQEFQEKLMGRVLTIPRMGEMEHDSVIIPLTLHVKETVVHNEFHYEPSEINFLFTGILGSICTPDPTYIYTSQDSIVNIGWSAELIPEFDNKVWLLDCVKPMATQLRTIYPHIFDLTSPTHQTLDSKIVLMPEFSHQHPLSLMS